MGPVGIRTGHTLLHHTLPLPPSLFLLMFSRLVCPVATMTSTCGGTTRAGWFDGGCFSIFSFSSIWEFEPGGIWFPPPCSYVHFMCPFFLVLRSISILSFFFFPSTSIPLFIHVLFRSAFLMASSHTASHCIPLHTTIRHAPCALLHPCYF